MTSVPHCACGESDFTPNVEAFEVFDELMCDECAEAAFEDLQSEPV